MSKNTVREGEEKGTHLQETWRGTLKACSPMNLYPTGEVARYKASTLRWEKSSHQKCFLGAADRGQAWEHGPPTVMSIASPCWRTLHPKGLCTEMKEHKGTSNSAKEKKKDCPTKNSN